MLPILFLTTILLSSPNVQSVDPSASTVSEKGNLIISSPLKMYTVFDGEPSTTPRKTFLTKFKSGISFQNKARKEMLEKEKEDRLLEEQGRFVDDDEGGDEPVDEWAEYSDAKEQALLQEKRQALEEAFESGFQSATLPPSPNKNTRKSENEYQFVGVVMPKKQVKWYARKKPQHSNWSVRMVHVDRAAILRDLFVRGKVDLYAEYKNKGVRSGDDEEDEDAGCVRVEPEYSVRRRDWRTLWNIQPIQSFTKRSGMYWREKRLSNQGLYTDGKRLYESTYRYSEGKNGMIPFDPNNINFQKFLGQWDAEKEDKEELLERLKSGSPDVVQEF